MLDRLRRAIRRIFGKLYGWAFRFRELYENRFEALVAVLELFLIGLGLTFAWVLHREQHNSIDWGERLLQWAEFGVFLLLLLLSVSRVLVAWRRTRLGYSYGGLVKLVRGRGPDSVRDLFHRIGGIGWGRAPGLEMRRSDRLHSVAKKIAHQTSGLLSVRSWFLRDERWQAREAESLGEWFRQFPASLWHVPASEAPQRGERSWTSGYFSVIVPMTPQSARSIRKGQRATDLAEIDPAAIRAFDPARTAPAKGLDRVELLAYLHIALVSRKERDEARLFAASVQHLAFLLRGLYGSREDSAEHWNFTVLCESSNRDMNRVLDTLGFEAVERERDGAPGEEREARSYAGFLLFELDVQAGHGKTRGADEFLQALRKLACPPVTPQAVSEAATRA